MEKGHREQDDPEATRLQLPVPRGTKAQVLVQRGDGKQSYEYYHIRISSPAATRNQIRNAALELRQTKRICSHARVHVKNYVAQNLSGSKVGLYPAPFIYSGYGPDLQGAIRFTIAGVPSAPRRNRIWKGPSASTSDTAMMYHSL
jgi:hypothetical protein